MNVMTLFYPTVQSQNSSKTEPAVDLLGGEAMSNALNICHNIQVHTFSFRTFRTSFRIFYISAALAGLTRQTRRKARKRKRRNPSVPNNFLLCPIFTNIVLMFRVFNRFDS